MLVYLSKALAKINHYGLICGDLILILISVGFVVLAMTITIGYLQYPSLVGFYKVVWFLFEYYYEDNDNIGIVWYLYLCSRGSTRVGSMVAQ